MPIGDITIFQVSPTHFKPARKALKRKEKRSLSCVTTKGFVTLADNCVFMSDPVTHSEELNEKTGVQKE